VFAAGKEQRDFAAFLCGNDTRREDAGPARQFRIFEDTLVIEELENLHRCVVVVEHLAGGALPNQLLENRLNVRSAIAAMSLDLFSTFSGWLRGTLRRWLRCGLRLRANSIVNVGTRCGFDFEYAQNCARLLAFRCSLR
jgi:hypothetical protein